MGRSLLQSVAGMMMPSLQPQVPKFGLAFCSMLVDASVGPSALDGWACPYRPRLAGAIAAYLRPGIHLPAQDCQKLSE
jgi:hypothetical protein